MYPEIVMSINANFIICVLKLVHKGETWPGEQFFSLTMSALIGIYMMRYRFTGAHAAAHQ